MKTMIMTMMLTGSLAACASAPAEPKIVTREVKVEVPVSCIPKTLPARPTFSDTASALKAAPSMEDRYRLIAGNWFPRDVRLSLLEDIVDECRRPPAPPD